MSSLGFSEYAESGNLNTNNSNNNNNNGNSNGKIYNRRNTNPTGNRTLKIPRNQSLDDTRSNGERGLLQSSNGNVSGITNENGTNQGMIQQAGQKIKQIKDYIENIHRKGGEDSDADENEMDSVLPAYPAQGMGVYATNVTSQGVIRGPDNSVSSNNGVVRKTTQMNSLNPASSYSSTLLEGMDPATNANNPNNPNNPNLQLPPGTTAGESGRFSSPPHFTTPYGDSTRNVDPSGRVNVTNSGRPTTSTYASQYYEQFVPYAETLANQLAGGGGGGASTGGSMSGTNAALIEKLNYIIHMMEDKKDEKTGHVIEELVLYCFLGIFIIFIVDTFTNTIPGNGRGGGGAGAGGRGFSMFGGRQTAQYRR
jgi:hypothetical protein